jgi:AGCS family alanine or glycine:cation symporter
MWGVKRGLFSNEAGQGSAPIAHAAAKTDEPVSEGVVALLEPFIDTLVICTMTALVIITTGMWEERVPTELQLRGGDLTWVAVDDDGVAEPLEELPRSIEVHEGRTEDGIALGWHDVPVERLYGDPEQAIPFTGRIDVERGLAIPAADDVERTSVWGEAVDSGAPLTMLAFRRGLQEVGDFGHYIVIVAVVLFGVSTAISWSYYGERCAHYVLGERAITPYRLIFVAMHFLGAIVPLSLAWTLGDAFMGIVIIPNLIALVLLSPQVAELTRSYFERKPWRQKKRGTG